MHIPTKRVHSVTLAFCAFVLGACGLGKPMPPLDSYAHQGGDGNVALYWNCNRPETGLVQVAGWANNPYYPEPITELAFTLYGLNAQGGTVSTAQASAKAFQIFTMEPTPFSIDLHTTGAEVQYQLLYSYYLSANFAANPGRGNYWRNVVDNICGGLAP